MIWNWNVDNQILYSWWHTHTVTGLLLSCILVAFISFSFEWLAYWQNLCDHEAQVAEASYVSISTLPASMATFRPYRAPGRLRRSIIYGVRSLLAIKLMLIAMTFNGQLILSIVGGAVAAHWLIGSGSSMCH